MEGSEKQEQAKKKITEAKTFSVPFALERIKGNITITTHTDSKPLKEQIINKAIKFHSEGNIAEAINYYQLFINKGFSDYRVFCNYGVLLKELGKLQEAEMSTRKAIRMKPNIAEAHSNLGNILKEFGRLQEAELSTRKAIKLKPDLANAHINLGLILKDMGKFEEGELQEKKGIDMEFIRNVDSKFKENCLKYLSHSKSQFRQDLFTLSQLNFKENGYFVEFGSCDGIVGSNSYLLEKFFNWDGILAEPAIYWHKKLRKNRSVNIETKCIWKSSGQEILFNEPISHKQLSTIDSFSNEKYQKKEKRYKVKTISLLDLLDKYEAPKSIDFLSIDTEGSEYEILRAFNFNKYKFRVITCEHNFSPIREKIYHLLTNNGYKRKLTAISRVDDWYILAE